MNNAIGLIELTGIARGYKATDGMLKAADVELIEAHTVCPGKFIALITGEVGDVERSVATGIELAEHTLVDDLIIPNIHPQLIPALRDTADVGKVDALGIVEFFSVASTIIAADAAAKKADVKLIEVRLANALGGKGFFTVTGTIEAVNSAITAGCDTVKEKGIIIERTVIPRPDETLHSAIL